MTFMVASSSLPEMRMHRHLGRAAIREVPVGGF
jgi:hypothetical protein